MGRHRSFVIVNHNKTIVIINMQRIPNISSNGDAASKTQCDIIRGVKKANDYRQ